MKRGNAVRPPRGRVLSGRPRRGVLAHNRPWPERPKPRPHRPLPTPPYSYRMDHEQDVRPSPAPSGAVTALPAEESEGSRTVTMYTTSWCSDCVAAKRYL